MRTPGDWHSRTTFVCIVVAFLYLFYIYLCSFVCITCQACTLLFFSFFSLYHHLLKHLHRTVVFIPFLLSYVYIPLRASYHLVFVVYFGAIVAHTVDFNTFSVKMRSKALPFISIVKYSVRIGCTFIDRTHEHSLLYHFVTTIQNSISKYFFHLEKKFKFFHTDSEKCDAILHPVKLKPNNHLSRTQTLTKGSTNKKNKN